ncbi:MAG TPA: hypothetical protein VNP73_10460 [Actinomycetota bacterium]|nr:hypothetical protein [Actinomycetota bacterium]
MTDPDGEATSSAPPDELRPLGFGEILERVFKICWSQAKTFLAIVGILIVPANLIFVAAFFVVPPELLAAMEPYSTVEPDIEPYIVRLIAAGVVALVGMLLLMLGTAAATGAAYVAAEASHAGLTITWSQALRTGMRRMFSILWIYFVTGMGLFLSFIIVLAPGLAAIVIDQNVGSILAIVFTTLAAFTVSGWLWLSWIFGAAVVMTEEERGTKALRRSYNLIKGRFWWTGGIVFTAMVIASFLGGIFTLPVAFASFTVLGDNIILDLAVRSIANVLGLLLSFPLQITALALLFVDARVVKEGLSKEQLQTEIQSSMR